MADGMNASWPDRQALMQLIDRWNEHGWLRELDRAFVRLLSQLDPEASSGLLLAAVFTSHQLGHGHVCLDLAETLASPDFALSLPPEGEEDTDMPLPSQLLKQRSLTQWLDQLKGPLIETVALTAQPGDRPLVLTDGRIYLRRYWCYEQFVAASIGERLSRSCDLQEMFPQWLDRLFGRSHSGTDWQKLAVALAVSGHFTLITGGPGTGKTTTVVRLLAVLQGLALEQGTLLRIKLAAPTGKAAARLSESIARQIETLPVDSAVRDAIPSDVRTLHRLLGSRPHSRHFRHDGQNPLPVDVLVVDEASMIDLEMMASLLAALPLSARLILLGDKNQLASVEAGAVMGDLCRDAEVGHYDPALQAWLTKMTGETIDGLQPGDAKRYPLAQRTIMLRHSRRFEADSGIGRLAERVNRQQAEAAHKLLQHSNAQLHYLCLQRATEAELERLFVDGRPDLPEAAGYRHYLVCLENDRPAISYPEADWTTWAAKVLAAFERFRLLCAVRHGNWGVEGLNQRIEHALRRTGLLQPETDWYEGRPVMITHNDYGLGLMNGDIGITLNVPVPDDTGRIRPSLRVAFRRNDRANEIRFVLPSRLTDVETVFAMTVHKSQGSEFDHAALILPDKLNPVLSKELLYTAITRARKQFSLIEIRAGVFEQAIQRRVQRYSGLMARLQPDAPK